MIAFLGNLDCRSLFFLLLTLLQMTPIPTHPLCSPQCSPGPTHGLHHPIIFVPGQCIYVLWLISTPSFRHSPDPFPSEICQFVSYIHASGSIFLSGYFVHYIVHIHEIIWYLSFPTGLFCLS